MANYDKKSQSKVGKVMDEFKSGELKSGNSGKTVKNRKQAIAIGLSEARKEGDKVPAAKKTATKTKPQRSATKKSSTTAKKKTAAKK